MTDNRLVAHSAACPKGGRGVSPGTMKAQGSNVPRLSGARAFCASVNPRHAGTERAPEADPRGWAYYENGRSERERVSKARQAASVPTEG
jgi:hypothetical protein